MIALYAIAKIKFRVIFPNVLLLKEAELQNDKGLKESPSVSSSAPLKTANLDKAGSGLFK